MTPRTLLKPVMLAALTITMSASAKELWEQPWIEVRSPHFIIVSAISEERTVDLAHELEDFRAAVQIITNIGRFEERIPTTVYVLPYGVAELGFKSHRIGYFAPRMRANYAAVTPLVGAQLDDTLKHEYVHFLLHNRDALAYPVWFDEGFAELLSTLTVRGNLIDFGKPSSNRIDWLRGYPWISFATVIGTGDAFSLTQSQTAMFYAQSWLLTHYLMNGRPDRKFEVDTTAYLMAVEAGTRPVEAFEQAFGLPVLGLKTSLARYWRKDFAYHRVRLSHAIAESPTQVQPMAQDSIAAQLGSLALLWEQGDEARRFWDAAIALNPNNSVALVGLGDLLKFAGRFDEAKPYYEKAIAAEPQNAYPELDYGEYFLDRAHAAAEPAEISGYLVEARRHFARSYKLDPDDPETLAVNGATYLFAGESVEKALQSLTTAHAMLPSQPDIKLLLAKAYVQSGEQVDAIRLLRSLVAWSHDGNGQEANELLQQLVKPTDDAAAAEPRADE